MEQGPSQGHMGFEEQFRVLQALRQMETLLAQGPGGGPLRQAAAARRVARTSPRGGATRPL